MSGAGNPTSPGPRKRVAMRGSASVIHRFNVMISDPAGPLCPLVPPVASTGAQQRPILPVVDTVENTMHGHLPAAGTVDLFVVDMMG